MRLASQHEGGLGILGPHLPASDAEFQALINRLYWWAHAA